MAKAAAKQSRRPTGARKPKRSPGRFSPRRPAIWVAAALAAIVVATIIAVPAPFDRPPRIRQSLPIGEPSAWYRAQPGPPRPVTAPGRPVLGEPGAGVGKAAAPVYEESLPSDIYLPTPPQPERSPAVVPPPEAAIARLAPGEIPAWRRHARAAPSINGRPAIAVVIDDMGVDRKQSARAINLPGPLTLSFLTYANDLAQQTAAARAAGHELMLHVPMEPRGSGVDPGPNVLSVGLPPDELRRRMEWAFSRFDGYVGVNNHMGSQFTADRDGMGVLIAELAGRGLLFLNSRTAPDSVGSALARRFAVPHVDRNIFLDNDNDETAVRARLAELESFARRHGQAIAIGHPRAATINVLQGWLATLAERGFVLVPISTLVHLPTDEHGGALAERRPEAARP